VALRFAALLKPIVDTIDRRGLSAYFLRKHLREVERFYGFLDKRNFDSDAAVKFKQRFEKKSRQAIHLPSIYAQERQIFFNALLCRRS